MMAKIFGPELLGASFGYAQFISGIAVLAGALTIGGIYKLEGSYYSTFIVIGSVAILGSIFVLVLYLVNRVMKRREARLAQTETEANLIGGDKPAKTEHQLTSLELTLAVDEARSFTTLPQDGSPTDSADSDEIVNSDTTACLT